MKHLLFDPRDPAFYNPIINSNLDFWQRGGSTIANRLNNSNPSGFWADRFFNGVAAGVSKSISIVRSANVPTTAIPCAASIQVTNNTAVASFPTAEWMTPFAHIIEGSFYRPFAGQKVTLGFWLFSSVGGTVAVAARRNGYTRSYVTTVNSTANTWEYFTVIIPVDTGGAAYDYSVGANCFDITIGAVSGTGLQGTNTWAAGNLISHASATNWAATAGAVMRTAQWQLRVGERSKDEMQYGWVPHSPSTVAELAACQRYCTTFQPSGPHGNGCFTQATVGTVLIPLPVEMRVTPATSVTNPGSYRLNNATNNYRCTTVAGTGGNTKMLQILMNINTTAVNGAAIASLDCDNAAGVGLITADAEF